MKTQIDDVTIELSRGDIARTADLDGVERRS